MGERFKNKSVLITGGGSGIGRAAAKAFALEGAKVLVSDIDGDAAEVVASDIRSAGGLAKAKRADVTEAGQCADLVRAAVDAFGTLDIAFNNAGVAALPYDDFENGTLDEWRRIMSVNADGVFNCIKAEVPAMKAAGGGAIVNTGSVASQLAVQGLAAYVASKHAVAGLTKAAAVDLIKHNIRVNAVCPGMIRTAMSQPLLDNPELAERFLAGVPAGKTGEPEDIAKAVLYLASDDARYVVGTLLTIDGGVMLL